MARILVTILVLIPYLCEHLIIKDFEKYTVYILLSKQKSSNATDKGLPITAILEASMAIILLCWLQIRIERDRIRYNERSPFWSRLKSFLKNDDNDQAGQEYSKNASRVIAVASVGVFAMCIISAARVDSADPSFSYQRLLVGLSVALCNSFAAPLLYVVKNKSIRKYFHRASLRSLENNQNIYYTCNAV